MLAITGISLLILAILVFFLLTPEWPEPHQPHGIMDDGPLPDQPPPLPEAADFAACLAYSTEPVEASDPSLEGWFRAPEVQIVS